MSPLNKTLGREEGVVLVITLILLLVMTLLGISAVRGTTLEERMAGNWRDQNIALQAAEAALRAGERRLAPEIEPPPLWAYPDCPENTLCEVFSARDNRLRPTEEGLMSSDAEAHAEWLSLSIEYDAALTGVARQPRSLTEHRGHVRDHLVSGFGPAFETGRDLYRITALGAGQSPVSRIVLQTHFAKRYN